MIGCAIDMQVKQTTLIKKIMTEAEILKKNFPQPSEYPQYLMRSKLIYIPEYGHLAWDPETNILLYMKFSISNVFLCIVINKTLPVFYFPNQNAGVGISH